MEANGQICFVCTKLFHPGDTYHTFRTIGGAALHLHGSCTEHLIKEAERIVRERKAHNGISEEICKRSTE